MAEQSAFDAALEALSGDVANIEVADESAFSEPKSERRAARNKARVKRSSTRTRKPAAKADDAGDIKSTIASVGSSAWGFAGYGLSNKGPENLVPVGRVMMFQAPAAGNHMANIIERTPLMQFLAPLSMNGGLIGDIAALIGPPMLIGLMASNPNMMTALQPFLRMIFIPLAKDIVAAQKDQGNILGDATEIDSETQEVLDMMMANLFAGGSGDGA